MEINKDNLEKALGAKSKKNEGKAEALKMSREAEIGFHEGALNTLASERIELIRIIQNVEKIMQLHLTRLEDLGVKFQENK